MQEVKPLRLLICDTCGRIITNPENAFVEWVYDEKDTLKAYGFRITHAKKFSPYRGICKHGCYQYGDQAKGDIALADYMEDSDLLMRYIDRHEIGERGYPSPNVKDVKEFEKLLARLSILFE